MLHGLTIPVVHAAIEGRLDEADTVEAALAVAAALTRLGARSDVVRLSPGLPELEALAVRRPALVFNLVEAIAGDAARAVEAMQRLEALDLAFTGGRSAAFRASNDKLAAKRILAAAGLPTPAWSLDGSLDAFGLAPTDRVIVKSVTEHGSLGIDAGSVVPASEAAQAIKAREARFGGRFFAEAFVEGREFNLSVLAGRVLPPAEIVFQDFDPQRPRIVDWDAKWVADSHGFRNTPRRFIFWDTDQSVLADLKRLALAACRAFGLQDYARVDFRVDADGKPWVLEANCNPCLTPDAGFAAAASAAGLGYDAVIERIARAALGHAQPFKAAA